jgi:ABC-type nitrate/sulfonate/bicarbonate transport system substrate-binding protein
VERSSDLFIFMSHSPAPELSLVVAPDIAAFEDLKGRVIAVDGARSGYALLLRKLLADKGLEESDCAFREFGGSRERHNALKNGSAVASFLNPPFDQDLFAAGFRSLGTTREYFPTYPGAICAARRSWAARNEKQLIAFIRGFRAAYAWLQDAANKAEAMRILPARLNLDPEAAADAFDGFAQREFPELTAEGLSQVIDIVWEVEGYSWPKPGAQRYFDPSFLRKAGA